MSNRLNKYKNEKCLKCEHLNKCPSQAVFDSLYCKVNKEIKEDKK